MHRHEETETGKWPGTRSHSKEEFETLSMPAFVSVVLAAILLGFIAHEFFHILTIANVSSITIRFGSTGSPFSVCCLEANENSMEEIAYLLQLIITVGWIILNKSTYVKKGH